MTERDYYDVLGVSRNASLDEIRRAHRKLAKKYHPDRNPGDTTAETRFKEAQAAYEILSHPEKRKLYDQFGHAGLGGGVGGGGWRSGPGGARVHTWKTGGGPDIPIEDLEDLFSVFGGAPSGGPRRGKKSIFEEFFRQSQQRRSPAHETPPASGRDIEHEASLSFEQAIAGTTLNLTLRPHGNRGSAQTIAVKIPAGVADGQRIRIKGKGHPGGRGVPAGDLYITCHIRPHPYFRREGQDIFLDLPLSISEAALGTKVEIPTLDGRTTLTVPPGTPSGAKLRLKGKGVKSAGRKPQGDQYAVIRILPPKSLSPEQKELLEKLRDIDTDSPRRNVDW